jgi:16S rRNA G527 N7-methylase RsmG
MLAHLNQELNLTHLEAERDRVRRQIQRQETVLTLSMLLKVWGDDGAGAGESSRWSDDSDEEEAGDLLDY